MRMPRFLLAFTGLTLRPKGRARLDSLKELTQFEGIEQDVVALRRVVLVKLRTWASLTEVGRFAEALGI